MLDSSFSMLSLFFLLYLNFLGLKSDRSAELRDFECRSVVTGLGCLWRCSGCLKSQRLKLGDELALGQFLRCWLHCAPFGLAMPLGPWLFSPGEPSMNLMDEEPLASLLEKRPHHHFDCLDTLEFMHFHSA